MNETNPPALCGCVRLYICTHAGSKESPVVFTHMILDCRWRQAALNKPQVMLPAVFRVFLGHFCHLVTSNREKGVSLFDMFKKK